MVASLNIENQSISGMHPIDIHVGSRLRQRREALYLTQLEVGELLGLTCQQIQKYECGSNRISASRLFELSRLLVIDINYFFDHTRPDVVKTSHAAAISIARRLGLSDAKEGEISQLTSLFSRICPTQKKRLLALMRLMENSVGDDPIPKI